MVSKSIASAIISGQKWEVLFSAVHIDALAVLLVLQTVGTISMDATYFKALVAWIAINLLVFPKARKRFTTPSVITPKCHYCGNDMTTTELVCEKCHATSSASKDGFLKKE
jgi:hypothetical protein